jgi:hypothetical protein
MALRNYDAANALERIRGLSAFGLPEAKRVKLNGTASLYTFPDGSKLQVNSATSRGFAWHPEWTGGPQDVHLGPVQSVPLRINRQGL